MYTEQARTTAKAKQTSAMSIHKGKRASYHNHNMERNTNNNNINNNIMPPQETTQPHIH